MRVAVPPTLDKITSLMRKGLGSTSRMVHISIVTGAINNIVVTLSKNAEETAVNKHNRSIKRVRDPLDRSNILTANHSKTPVWDSSPMMIIIPNNKPSVDHS